MNPTISIIIPAYNVENYLHECLDSVLTQDNGRLEIIIVDDASTDSTPSICEEYRASHPFIRYFRKENGGPSAARNFGIRKAQGEYLLFLDSDDLLMDNAISTICEKIDATIPDVIIGRYNSFYDTPVRTLPCHYQLDGQAVRARRGEDLLLYLMNGRIYDWYSWLYIIRTRLILDHNLFYEVGIDFGEDARLVPKILMEAASVEYMDSPFYLYRRNREGSITATFSSKYFGEKLSLLSYFEAFCAEHHFSQSTRMAMLANMANVFVSALFDAWYYPPQQRRAYLEALKPYKFILANSARRYHRLLSLFWSVFGLKMTSYILYLRASRIRKKMASACQ